MMQHLLVAGVQNHEDTDQSSNVFGISGQLQNGIAAGLHEGTVDVNLIGLAQSTQDFRHRDDYMEIRDGQHFFFPQFQPTVGLVGVALWAASIFARVVRVNLLVA